MNKNQKNLIEKVLNINPENLNAYSSGLLQGKAYRSMNVILTRALFPYDLSIPEWKLLGQLYEHKSMKLSDLAELLNVEAPLVTALIDKLEKKKLVFRQSHPDDRRAKIILTTIEGKQLISRIEPEIKRLMKELLRGVSADELRVYIHVLQTIVNNSTK